MSDTNNIINRLEATGYMTKASYTHEQLLDELKGFEKVSLQEVYRASYSDCLRTYDLISHFRDMASQYALCDTEVYGRLIWSLQHLSKEISSLVNGARGERCMRRSLGWLTCEHEILLNVELEYEGERCEYDAIVLTPSGIDIVESKYLGHDAVIDKDGFLRSQIKSRDRFYNVGEKMRAKEHVLFKVIENAHPGAIPRSCIRSILLATNNNTRIEDNFNLIDVCNCGKICPLIENRKGPFLKGDYRAAIISAIEEARQVFLYEPAIDFDQLRSDMADFIVMVERASARSVSIEECSIEAGEPGGILSGAMRREPISEIVNDAISIALYAIGGGAICYGMSKLIHKLS